MAKSCEKKKKAGRHRYTANRTTANYGEERCKKKKIQGKEP
jgi:hypothetical protein